jgi:hypothetical protein
MLRKPPEDVHSDTHAGKQIWNEGRPVFETRPVHFKLQEELIAFVTSRTESIRRRVTTVKLCLQDLEASRMRPCLEDEVMGHRRTRSPHPYKLELHRISTALNKLPALQSIALLHPHHTESNLPPRFIVAGILQHICRRFPQLKHIRLDYDGHSLEPLASLTNLNSLTLSGFSATPPESAETAVFAYLRNLKSLHLLPHGFANRRPFFKATDPEQSFNASVLASLPPLRSVALFEPPNPSRPPSLPPAPTSRYPPTTTASTPPSQPTESRYFLTAPLLKALITHHAPTLTSLSLTSLLPLATLIPTIIAALLLSTTSLHTLMLTFPGIEPSLLDALPSSLEDLTLLVNDQLHARVLGERLEGGSHRLGRLRRVRFVVLNAVQNVRLGGVHAGVAEDECGSGVGREEDGEGGASGMKGEMVGFALPCMGIGRSATAAEGRRHGSPSKAETGRRWTVRWGIWQPFGED